MIWLWAILGTILLIIIAYLIVVYLIMAKFTDMTVSIANNMATAIDADTTIHDVRVTGEIKDMNDAKGIVSGAIWYHLPDNSDYYINPDTSTVHVYTNPDGVYKTPPNTDIYDYSSIDGRKRELIAGGYRYTTITGAVLRGNHGGQMDYVITHDGGISGSTVDPKRYITEGFDNYRQSNTPMRRRVCDSIYDRTHWADLMQMEPTLTPKMTYIEDTDNMPALDTYFIRTLI